MRLGLGDEAAQRESGPLPRIVLVDANIFFAPRLRDLFMHLHEAEALSIHWTREKALARLNREMNSSNRSAGHSPYFTAK
jgi:hypothetical protein